MAFVSVRGMGEMIEFPSNGDTATGYLATPAQTPAPGVLVLQEWWGLVPQITATCDRFAAEGFVALAPDLYHGEIAEHTEMDKAGELMNALPPERAGQDMGAAVDYLLASPLVWGDSVGAVGLLHGWPAHAGRRRAAGRQDRRRGPVLRRTARRRGAGLVGPHRAGARPLRRERRLLPDSMRASSSADDLEAEDKDVTFVVYPGMGHAFANEEDPLGNYDEPAAKQAWARTIDFLRTNLG